VYDSYWRFAAERLAVYNRRLQRARGPWTEDRILRTFRFTNTYRAADRVSQYLIREVQYREDRSQAPSEVFFRTLLFKLFNRIDTWELLERLLGPLSWQSVDLDKVSHILDAAMLRGTTIYSAAYIMPAPKLGRVRKHANHLLLLKNMMEENLAGHIAQARNLATVYDLLRPWPGIGNFLAFQYAIDLNYSSMLEFSEADFVVAGPGALDGIAKCFVSTDRLKPQEIIYMMVDRQEREFARLGLDFAGLFGRPLQPIDCQNLFCEISKYARVAHPNVMGSSGRTRIKQSFAGEGTLPRPVFPPRWNLTVSDFGSVEEVPRQRVLI
jgi:hypothetical protein